MSESERGNLNDRNVPPGEHKVCELGTSRDCPKLGTIMTDRRGWWNMPCWNGLSAEQQRRLIEVGNLPIDYTPEGECQNGATLCIETQDDEAPGPRFYCTDCGAAHLAARIAPRPVNWDAWAQDVGVVPKRVTDDEATSFWSVSINNGQKDYIVEADSAGAAGAKAGAEWRIDPTVKPRQHARGIYDIRVRRAKFGEVRQQVVLPVTREGQG